MRTATVVFLMLSPGLAARGAVAQEAEPAASYRVFTGEGEPASLDAVVVAMGAVDVVFVGETHDDPTGHWIENELFRRAYAAYGVQAEEGVEPRKISLSLEFFERDVQEVIDEYLADLISERTFLAASRPWPDYETDYRPIVEFAKERGLDVVASNAPRRYANRVTSHGRESLLALSAGALATLPPLPYGTSSTAYRAQWFQVMAEVQEEESQKCGVPIEPDSAGAGPTHDHVMMANQLHTQTLWDATMAFWVADHLMRNPGVLLIHMVGSFHVENGTGIPEHLESYRPGTSRLIVAMRPVENIDAFDPTRDGENEDFVILTDESLTRSELECERAEEGTPS